MQKYIIPFLLFVIGFYLLGIQVVGWNFDGMPGNLGDGRLNNYFLEQGWLYISGNINSYWDAGFFYPTRSTMSMSDNLFGTLPVYSLFRFFMFDRETAFQLWYLTLLSLNYFVCLLVLKKFKLHPIAAAAGAYIFAFSLPVAGGIGHIQMLPKFAFPLIIFFLIRFIQDKKPVFLFFFLFWTVFQMYCGIYLGFMSIIASVCVFFIMSFSLGFRNEMRSWWFFLKKKVLHTTIFLGLHFCILLLLLRPYIVRSGDVERTYMDPARGLPGWISYLYPPPGTLFYEWLRPLGKFLFNEHEHTLFMGITFFISLVLSIYLIKVKKLKELKIWLISLLVIILLTLNISHYVSLYIIVYIIPGFEAIRAVSRIVQIELFFLAGLVAVIIHHYLKTISSGKKSMIFIGVVLLFVVSDQFISKEGLMIFSKKESQDRILVLKSKVMKQYNELPASKESSSIPGYYSLVYLPGSDVDVYKFHLDAMIVSQDLGINTVNGYSAFSPKQFEDFSLYPDRNNFENLLEKDLIPHKTLILVEDQ